MALNIKIGNLDIQFGQQWDQVKANQLVQSLQQVIGAVRTLSNLQNVTPPPPAIAVHELADDAGLGPFHTVQGLEANQVLVATAENAAHFDLLHFGQLFGTDPATFDAPTQGDIISYRNGFWSAITLAAALGLADPGTDAIIMWDPLANGGAGGLAWALAGAGISISSGQISAVPIPPVINPAATDAMSYFLGF